MRGELFRFFDVSASGYFVLLLTGFLFATAAGTAWARRIGQDPDVVVDLGLAALLLGIIGGKLLHVLADGMLVDYVNMCLDPTKVNMKVERAVCATAQYDGVWDAAKGYCHPREADCLRWAKFWTPGYAYYGGLIFASVGSWFLLKRDRFPFWRAADMAGFAIPIGLGFGRMGCLLAGCCFGSPTGPGFMSLQFPPTSAASKAQFELGLIKTQRMWSMPVHPTQILESAGSLAIAAFCLFYIHGRKKYDGHVFVWFIGLYAALRFVLEFYRADDRGSAGGLLTSQLIGLGLVVAAYLVHRRLAPKGVMPSVAPAAT